MRAAFSVQLDRELRGHGCKAAALREAGAEHEPTAVALPVNPAPPATPRPAAGAPAPAPPSHATFFVDNRTCPAELAVYVDGARLGAVAGGERGAFRALPGRHSMCLIPATSPATCGVPGTARNVFVSDGWSITMHCLK